MKENIGTIIKVMKDGKFNCMPLPEFRDKEYIDPTIKKAVTEAGFQLKWFDTFKGGCWHVIPSC